MRLPGQLTLRDSTTPVSSVPTPQYLAAAKSTAVATSACSARLAALPDPGLTPGMLNVCLMEALRWVNGDAV